uniref:hypothetical protein n=1 Tax=Paractinoplanes polyasparticus TaxID=2856853 RepID=UPI001C85DA3C|nr:hypothetical protein [Actinoplanes polyasparticus]
MDAQAAVDKVGWLIRGHVADTVSDAEVRDELGMTARHSTLSLRQALEALDELLNEEQPPGTLLDLIAWDGGRALGDDQTDGSAAVYLRHLAGLVREAIAEAGHR